MERVIVQESAAPGFLNEAEVLHGTASLYAQVLAWVVGDSLVIVAQDHQADAASSHVAEVEHEILRQLLLNGAVPALDIAGAVIRWNVVGANVPRADVLEIHEAVRVSLLGWPEA